MIEAALSHRLPTEDEAATAATVASELGKAMTPDGVLPITLTEDSRQVPIELPPAIGEVVLEVLAHIAQGNMVTLVPFGAVLTTQQAADLLNVSRPFLTRLLESGEIDFHKVGSHRRIKAEDVLDYKKKRDSERSDALREMQRLGQEFDAAT